LVTTPQRHLMSTTSRQHGRPAELKPDSTLLTQVLDFQKNYAELS